MPDYGPLAAFIADHWLAELAKPDPDGTKRLQCIQLLRRNLENAHLGGQEATRRTLEGRIVSAFKTPV